MQPTDLRCIALPAIPDLLALQRRAPQRYPCLLESAASGTERGRYDLLLATDGTGLRMDQLGAVFDLAGNRQSQSRFLDALDATWATQATTVAGSADTAAAAQTAGIASPLPAGTLASHAEAGIPSMPGLPFNGGWAVFLAYELAGEIEPSLQLPAARGELPIACALRCPVALVVDRVAARAWLLAEPSAEQLSRAVTADLSAPTPPDAGFVVEQLHEEAADIYLHAVQRSLEYIRAGDVFQVNLSRSWQAHIGEATAPADLYRALRRANPAPFSALFALRADQAVVSSSPERLVSRRGERIETRPIAGTRPRLPGDDDAARVRELVGHPKERAEHIMLIDLERNDLGRVSVAGSVKVDELMAVETYAHVHHIESTVSGRALPGLTPGQLIRAVFPGGTITGCPKVRCMQIIADLEGEGRGPYTGAIGWLARSGDLDLNILIRTLWLDGEQLRFRAGAGIVADSDPQHELGETRAKARGLLRALGQGAT